MILFKKTFFQTTAENSNCDDAEYSSVNDRLDNIWLSPPDVYYSYDACKASIQDDSKWKYCKEKTDNYELCIQEF